MKIALIAPLWESVPPKAYGGTELVVYNLCQEYVKKGHDVTLYASACSKTSAKLIPMIDVPLREAGIEYSVNYELKSVSKILKDNRNYDIIHNHMGPLLYPFINLLSVPCVTTLHGAFIVPGDIGIHNDNKDLNYISISNSQRVGAPNLNYTSTVYNGIEVEKYKFEALPDLSDPYLAFLGRFSPEKGPHLAIQIAKATGKKLIMAGKVATTDLQYFEEFVKPDIDNKQISFIGELQHDAKVELLKNAMATLHPVTWPEPFGLVMAESMACGTPVLALNQGSIPEVIVHKKTGFVEEEVEALIERVNEIDNISRFKCRSHIESNFSSEKMADGYIKSYKKIICEYSHNIQKMTTF